MFRRQRRLVDRSREVRGQEPFLHGLDFSGPFLEGQTVLALNLTGVLERGLQRPVEPVGQFTIGNANRFEVRHDRVFEIIAAPAHARVILVRVVVRAPVVIVWSHTAALQLPLDPFASDQRPAVLAGEESARQRHVDLRRGASNLAVEQVLALRERAAVDQRAMLACEVSFAPFDVADEGVAKLQQYANWLEREWPSAAGSLREGLSELFTINRLGLPSKLRRCLGTTNLIDNSHSAMRQRTDRVKRWQSGGMALRWAASSFDAASKNFRRIMGHEQLWMLKASLDETAKDPQANTTEPLNHPTTTSSSQHQLARISQAE